jgi:hypothetical protein
MHRLGAVAHKSSTCLCTDSREAVLLPGWQAAAARRAGACVPGQPAGCEDLARTWMRSPQEGNHRMIAAAQRTPARQNQASPRQDSRLPGFADAARRPPVPDTRAKDRFPGSSHVPGSPPRWDHRAPPSPYVNG